MYPRRPKTRGNSQLIRVGIYWLAVLFFLFPAVFSLPPVAWSATPQVQEIKGRLELQENLLYELPSLNAGDRFSVYLKGLSDTLDTFAAILKPEVDLKTLQRDYLRELKKKKVFFQAKPEDLTALNRKFFAAWDDNSGEGHAASFTFTVSATGKYYLLVCSTPWRLTFGNFRMLLGLNAPEVTSGQASPTGHQLANHAKAVWQAAQRVDEIDGKLTPEQPYRSVGLNRIYKGETLYFHLEVTSGSAPTAVLQDYSGIPLVSGQPGDQSKVLTRSYTFGENDNSLRLRVFFPPGPGKLPHCSYRLLVGLNTPQVLTGQASKQGRPIIQHPIPVKIGLRMDQISDVD